MHVVFGNYGNESLALIEWTRQENLKNVTVISVDTGAASASWLAHVTSAEAYVRRCGFTAVRLRAQPDFAQEVLRRHAFPSQQFQWCASLLKGITLLNYLDNVDPQAAAVVLLAKRRLAARTWYDLPEWEIDNPYFGERKVWHPLHQHDRQARDALLRTAGFVPMTHRSLECEPCIFNQPHEFERLSFARQQAVADLELAAGVTMFAEAIGSLCQQQHKQQVSSTEFGEQFAKSCGDHFACGE